jgi:hypothetical protein
MRRPLPPTTRCDAPVRGRALAALVLVAGLGLASACAAGPDATIRRPDPTGTGTPLSGTGTGSTVGTAPVASPRGADGLPLAKVVVHDDGDSSSFDAPDLIAPGPISIEFTNMGAAPHDLTILRPRANVTISQLDGLLSGPAPDAAFAAADLLGGAGTLAPQGTQTVAVLLAPGDYQLASMERGFDGRLGTVRGLHRRLRVVGPPATPGQNGVPALPTVIGAVGLHDDSVELPATFTPGWYRVSNVGRSVHDLTLARVNDGVKADDVKQWLRSADDAPPPSPAPFAFAGGAAPLDPATSVWVKLVPPPGQYVAWDNELDRGGDFGAFRDKGMFATFPVA